MKPGLTLPKVRIEVSYNGGGAITRIYKASNKKDSAPVAVRESDSPIIGIVLLREAIPVLNLTLPEIEQLRN
jgi:hypothetical protein